MADNVQKTPFAPSLNRFAQEKILDAVQQLGKALPCHVTAVDGQIVTVAFDVNGAWTLPTVTMPIATSIYDWLPIQVGDKGYTAPADVYMGGVSGLGGGTADLTRRGNLATLVFTPVSNSSWTTADVNRRVVQGPEGVLAQDMGGKSFTLITPTGITITATDGEISITSNTQITLTAPIIALNGYLTQTGQSGGVGVQIEGPVHVTNDVVANGISVDSHVHGGVQTGGGETGEPVT